MSEEGEAKATLENIARICDSMARLAELSKDRSGS